MTALDFSFCLAFSHRCVFKMAVSVYQQRGLMFWVPLHVLAFVGLGLFAFLVPSTVAGSTYPLAQPLNASVRYTGEGRFNAAPNIFGRLLLAPLQGQARFEQLKGSDFGGARLVLCNASLQCVSVGVFPLGLSLSALPTDFGGELYYQGSYAFALPSLSWTPFFARAQLPDGLVLGQTDLFYPVPPPNASNLLDGSIAADPQTIGIAYDVNQMFISFALFLLAVCGFSMLLTWRTRTLQTITIILICCIFCNGLVVLFQASANIIRSASSCVALGFFQQLTACSTIAFYALSTVHFFCLLFRAGVYKAYIFTEKPLLYLLIGFGFPILDCAIVWALTPVNLSFGLMAPWRFCWIRTDSSFVVLLGAFYVPAFIVVLLNLVLSLILVVHVVRVRKSAKKTLDKDTVYATVTLFLSTNVGTFGFSMLGLFSYLSSSSAFSLSISAAIFAVMAALLFLQALVYWYVYFATLSTMEMWGLVLSCQPRAFRDLQKKNSNLKQVSMRLSTESTLKALNTLNPEPTPAPGNDSVSAGVTEI